MKAWRFHEFGSVRNLRLEDAPDPEPAAGEALVRIEYAGINPADAFLIIGSYPGAGEPPLVVGRDGCGTIERAAEGGRFKVGDRVVFLRSEVGVTRNGTLAQLTTVPDACLAPLPGGWSPEEGAGAGVVHLTAWIALVDECRVTPASRVLITGASGGVGTAALQQAKAHGCRVAALSRSPEKAEKLREMGADAVFDPSDAELVKKVKAALGPGPGGATGADIVIENVGGEYLQQSLNACAPGGRLALIGLLAGVRSEIELPTMLFNGLHIAGIFMGRLTPDTARQAWDGIVELLGRQGRRPIIDSVHPIDDVPAAFKRLREGPLGKVVIGPMNG